MSEGVAVPVPPSTIGRGICKEMFGVVPPDEIMGRVAVTDVTEPGAVPAGTPGAKGKYCCKPPVNAIILSLSLSRLYL